MQVNDINAIIHKPTKCAVTGHADPQLRIVNIYGGEWGAQIVQIITTPEKAAQIERAFSDE